MYQYEETSIIPKIPREKVGEVIQQWIDNTRHPKNVGLIYNFVKREYDLKVTETKDGVTA